MPKTNPYIVRTVNVPGRHVVIIDARTSEIIKEFHPSVTEAEAFEEAERLWHTEIEL